MKLREKQFIFQGMMADLIDWSKRNQHLFVITEIWRSKERQADLVARGYSKTMRSKHLDGLAFDIALMEDLADGDIDAEWEAYEQLGKHWEYIGGTWGGRFGALKAKDGKGWDPAHFEWKERE